MFGNHKTALKAGFGKYNSQYSSGFTGTFNPLAQQTESVTWNTNTNPALGPVLDPSIPGQNCTPVKIAGIIAPNPNCYPVGGFAPQGNGSLRHPPGHLGPSPNPTFGSAAASTGVNLDPNWHRDYNYQYTAGVQQELRRGVTLNANWFRRSAYQQFFLVNGNGIPASSWSPFNIVNPLDGTPSRFSTWSDANHASARQPARNQRSAESDSQRLYGLRDVGRGAPGARHVRFVRDGP